MYFDVVICLIPLTDSFFFCVINQDFCFVLAWSLKILARSLFMFVFWRVIIYVVCFDVVLQYFDVVINLISLTDCPLFLCDNFP